VKPNDLLGIANTRTDLFGAALAAFMHKAAHHIAVMGPLGEARPLASNRVTLSSSTDPYGVPLPVVTHAFDPDSLALSAATSAEGMAVMTAAGATETWAGAPAMQHILGGAIMGSDPATSVTNGYGQAHDLPNLFIAGSSLFPTSGAMNPTFTICALALRTADHLLDKWRALAGPV
jgi:choline dehydrogenase-like flavoprotein